ncbi:Response regulator receiver domain-containing protein [Pedobacter africanus]|uniref:Response regulator receiver domain-containing protein n=1 Tax=Pedobacter africanus TaxID=151894 RepID=A0A1W2AFC9_9SPHI|nr:response regulator [Pedobacter africanus]SMC59290.1 Response regulator receiver domain-containing protein [Pedobacter africanus]
METILVQDKDDAVLDVLSLALQEEGFEVISVNTCDEKKILELIDQQRPHVVMLDIRMSDQDCIDVCKLIKLKYPHLPVIALSCNNNVHEQYNTNGFDGYIKKPFDLDLLYKIIRKHISG